MPQALRLFLTAFLLVVSVGYSIGLFFVDHTTSATPTGIEERFLGSQDPRAEEMMFEKPASEMYVFLHNHILSLSLVFFAVGGIFYFSSIVSDGWKTFLVVEPFVAILTTFGGISLVRLGFTWLSWIVLISGLSLFACYFTMVALILVELWMVTSDKP